MKYEKGKPKTGGRKPGSKNAANKMQQQFWQGILDDETEHIKVALQLVRQDDPANYLKIVVSLTEFVLPKLARTELSGMNGDTISVSLNLNSKTVDSNS